MPVQGSKGSLDNINLFSIITILSFLLLTPFALLRDGGFTFSASSMRGMGILDPNLVMRRAILAGFCFHAYQQVITAASGDAGITQPPVSLLHAASRVSQSCFDSKRTLSCACLPCPFACRGLWEHSPCTCYACNAHDQNSMLAGVLHDLAAGVASDPLHR